MRYLLLLLIAFSLVACNPEGEDEEEGSEVRPPQIVEVSIETT